MELIERLAPRQGESVLDIGCGDGRVSAELARRTPGGRVVGVDSSPEMIEKARASFPPDIHRNISFEIMDARSLAFQDSFDAAFSNAALHWVKDHPTVLRGTARALKRGGRLLFQMGGRGNGEAVFEVAQAMIAEDRWRQYFEGFAGWIRTTWMPYTQRVPEHLREPFIREAAARYAARHPMEAEKA
jgi:trans-aconitate methyltransferase